jgi:predicted neuraminidase
MHSWTKLLLIAACCSSPAGASSSDRPGDWQDGSLAAAAIRSQSPPLKVASDSFVFTQAPFASAHASTIVETPTGLVAAWFGGTREKHPDVGIWLSRQEGPRWSPPVEVANGVQPDRRRYPCWNPVLFRTSDGPLWLFYKVGPTPSHWWGLVMRSHDDGRTWGAPTRLPEGILGPVRVKPVQLGDGTLLAGSSTEHDGWRVHMEWTRDPAGAWQKTPPLNAPSTFSAIQPTILVHDERRIQILCRTEQGVIAESWSEDAGRSWSPLRGTALPNPSAGVDSVRLADGRFLLVYNPTRDNRRQLQIALSPDGRSWAPAVMLEDSPGEYSYPAVIQARDGRVHVTYTWRRERIKHVVLDVER